MLDLLVSRVKQGVVDVLRSEDFAAKLNGKVDVPGLDEALEAEVIKKVLGAAADAVDEL